MKKIILSLIIIAAIVGGYVGYQQYSNSRITQFHDQLDDVKIQTSGDGDTCTDNSDCTSCHCYSGFCVACVSSELSCSNDGECCAGDCNDNVCNVTSVEAGLEYFSVAAASAGLGTGAAYSMASRDAAADGDTDIETEEEAEASFDSLYTSIYNYCWDLWVNSVEPWLESMGWTTSDGWKEGEGWNDIEPYVEERIEDGAIADA